MKQENERRRQECKELYDMLTKDRQKMSEDLLRETSQVRDILDKDKKARLEERSCQDKEVNKLITIVQFRVKYPKDIFGEYFVSSLDSFTGSGYSK